MQKSIVRKGLVVGIVVLFIGIVIIPCDAENLAGMHTASTSNRNIVCTDANVSGNNSKIKDSIDSVKFNSNPLLDDIYKKEKIGLGWICFLTLLNGDIEGHWIEDGHFTIYAIDVKAKWVYIGGWLIFPFVFDYGSDRYQNEKCKFRYGTQFK